MKPMRCLSILLFSGTVLFVAVSSAVACVCAGEQTVDAAFAQASTVFVGRFVGSEYRGGIKNEFREMQKSGGENVGDYQVLVYKFDVKTAYKGTETREVIIVTGNTRAKDGAETISDCELGFEKDREYLVYAALSDGHLYSGACTRTARVARAKKDILRLEKLSDRRSKRLDDH